MFIQNALQSYLSKQKANRMTDIEISNLMHRLHITVKFEDNLIMFVYKDIADFSNDVVKNSRGIILYRDTFEIACYPFDKFNNYTSLLADTIDWDNAIVYEKLDGQIIKIWYNKYNRKWMISSNSAIYANNKLLKDIEIDYSILDKDKTYMFEFISPYNKIVINYDTTELYLIGIRNNISQKEESIENIDGEWFRKPKKYAINSLDEAIRVINEICIPGDRHEGFVVVDKNYHRLKVKSQFYFDCKYIMSKLNTNNKETTLEFIENNLDRIEDIVKKVPEMEQKIRYYIQTLKDKYIELDKILFECLEKKQSYLYKIDYINWLNTLDIKDKKFKNLLSSFYSSDKSIVDFKKSINKKVIYGSIKVWEGDTNENLG